VELELLVVFSQIKTNIKFSLYFIENLFIRTKISVIETPISIITATTTIMRAGSHTNEGNEMSVPPDNF